MDHIDLVWVLRDRYIGNTFFDASSSAFIMPELQRRSRQAASFEESDTDICKDNNVAKDSSRDSVTHLKCPSIAQSTAISMEGHRVDRHGYAVGPDWTTHCHLNGGLSNNLNGKCQLQVSIARLPLCSCIQLNAYFGGAVIVWARADGCRVQGL